MPHDHLQNLLRSTRMPATLKDHPSSGSLYLVAVGLACGAHALGSTARGDRLYAIDSVADQLVIVDTDALTVTPVGPLGVDVEGSDGLAPLSQCELLAVLFVPGDTFGGLSWYLHTVRTDTGRATRIDPDPIERFAESLAEDLATGDVFVAHGTDAGASDHLGRIDPTNASTSPLFDVPIDMDEIELWSDDRLLAVDNGFSSPDTPFRDLYHVDLTEGTAQLRARHTDGFLPTGLALLVDGTLVAIGPLDWKEPEGVRTIVLNELDPQTGEVRRRLGVLYKEPEFGLRDLALPLPRRLGLSLRGECPGTVQTRLKCATPFGRVAFLFSPRLGRTIVSSGNPCAGLELQLGRPIRTMTVVAADSNGQIDARTIAPRRVCQGFVQAIDLSTYTTSAAASMP